MSVVRGCISSVHRSCRAIHKRYYGTNTSVDIQQQKSLIEAIASDLKYKSKEDFYGLTTQHLEERGAESLVKLHGHTYSILKSLYPEYEWLPWKFHNIPKGLWDDIENQRKYLDWVAKELNITKFRDWYKVTKQDIINVGGSSLLASKYNHSPSKMLSTVYPEFDWLPWKFVLCPRGYWDDINNQRNFLEYVAKELKIQHLEDWYKVTQQDIINHGGTGLLVSKYNGSVSAMLCTVFPDHEWLPWKLDRCPRGFWDNESNQRKFLDWVGKELKLKDLSGWYTISKQSIVNMGGKTLLCHKYNDSPSKMLSGVYPEYEWLPWKFHVTPKGYWDDVNNLKKFLVWAAKELNIKEPSEWKNVKRESLREISGGLLQIRSLQEILSVATGAPVKLINKKSQALLKSRLQKLFPNEEVFEDYKHPDIVYSSGHKLELDYYFPNLKLALEYQGVQHYKPSSRYHDNLQETQQKDSTKVEMCKKKGISLVEIPYWWDNKLDSLAVTIYNHRPDLFPVPPTGNPIPLTEPSKHHKVTENRESNARKLIMTSTTWEPDMDPTGWWMSEKYDGIRLFWNGQSFYSRAGKKVTVPESIKSKMPTFALDGELWTQYGLYQEAVVLTTTTDENKWKKAAFIVFDAPEIAHKTYEERMEFLQSVEFSPFIRIADSVKCEGKDHLVSFFNQITAKGGEGVMLREPGSIYRGGRSPSLRKYKQFSDCEVKVLETNYPQGFNCLQSNGKSVFVAVSADNEEEAKNVRKGDVITVKFYGTNVYGTLQYPKFYRQRKDVSWDDVIKNAL